MYKMFFLWFCIVSKLTPKQLDIMYVSNKKFYRSWFSNLAICIPLQSLIANVFFNVSNFRQPWNRVTNPSLSYNLHSCLDESTPGGLYIHQLEFLLTLPPSSDCKKRKKRTIKDIFERIKLQQEKLTLRGCILTKWN